MTVRAKGATSKKVAALPKTLFAVSATLFLTTTAVRLWMETHQASRAVADPSDASIESIASPEEYARLVKEYDALTEEQREEELNVLLRYWDEAIADAEHAAWQSGRYDVIGLPDEGTVLIPNYGLPRIFVRARTVEDASATHVFTVQKREYPELWDLRARIQVLQQRKDASKR